MDTPPFGTAGSVTPEELQLATRNHGLPLEALRYAITPPGLHYLLIHYDVPDIDTATWSLEIGGRVGRPERIDLAGLRARPRTTVAVTMECAGNGRALLDPRPLSQPWLVEAIGTAEWTGTSLRALLEEADVADDAVDIVFTGGDRGFEGGIEQAYERALPVADARRPEVLLAYEMNGQPLLPQHGAPVRLVTPGWYGMTNVKWLSRITASSEPFTGYQQEHAYRFRIDPDDAGTPMSRMRPRALMTPPGMPHFYSRHRVVTSGQCRLTGRAWSGTGAITTVDVSSDGGETWRAATVEPQQLGRWAWQGWSFDWDARPGEYTLCCRAADDSGAAQAETPAWNVGGYANPRPHTVPVTVQ